MNSAASPFRFFTRASARFLAGFITAAACCATSLQAQVAQMQDNFTYTTTNINGHAPTTGTGTWATNYGSGSNISTNGTKALMVVNSGTIGASSAIANYAFTPAANTLYSLQVSLNYTGPIGTGHDCWGGIGFSNGTNGGNSGTNIAPWMLIRPQATATDTPGAGGFHGSTSTGSGTVPAADFANPVIATVTWNTSTGASQFFIDGVLQSTWSTTTSLPTGSFYAFVQGFQTGSSVNINNVTLTAQTLTLGSMQDNFTYTTANINGHAPTLSPGGLGTWSIWSSSGTISTDGTQAVVLTNGGTPGSGQVISSFPFMPSPGMVYTIRETIKFRGPIGAGYDCWTGFGFSSGGTNHAPWMFIRPQGVSTDTPQVCGENNGAAEGSGNVPAADYSAPITATITWNTGTGKANFYVDNQLVSGSWTASSYVPTGAGTVYFQGFQTGNACTVLNYTLTAQPLPLPTVIFVPNDPAVGGIPTDFMSQYTSPGSTQWTTARSFSNITQLGSNFVTATTAANLSTIVSFANANGLKVGVDAGMLVKPVSGCGGGEGYDTVSHMTSVANALHTAGATQIYIQMDEPLEMGVEPAGIGPSWSCNLSMATAASQVNTMLAPFITAFGAANVFVGDTEPEGSIPESDIANWMAAFHTATGRTLQYIDNDYDFRIPLNPTINPDMLAAFSPLSSSGVTFGMIFGGGGNFAATSNAMWVRCCEENIQIYNAIPNMPSPQHISIASWGPYPTNVLPETSNTTLSNFCDYYFLSPYAAEAPPIGWTFLNKNGSNFFTSLQSEINTYVTNGWRNLRVQCAIYAQQSGAATLVPLYRYYNATSGYYAYTISPSSEGATLVSQGFVQQAITGYVFPDATQGGTPLYKFQNTTTNDYYYTPNASDTGGMTAEGIECYMPCNYMPNTP